jgi:hypothetical protein
VYVGVEIAATVDDEVHVVPLSVPPPGQVYVGVEIAATVDDESQLLLPSSVPPPGHS